MSDFIIGSRESIAIGFENSQSGWISNGISHTNSVNHEFCLYVDSSSLISWSIGEFVFWIVLIILLGFLLKKKANGVRKQMGSG